MLKRWVIDDLASIGEDDNFNKNRTKSGSEIGRSYLHSTTSDWVATSLFAYAIGIIDIYVGALQSTSILHFARERGCALALRQAVLCLTLIAKRNFVVFGGELSEKDEQNMQLPVNASIYTILQFRV